MLITTLADCLVQRHHPSHMVHKVAPYVDLALALSLVVLALLGIYQVVPLSGTTSFWLLGAGVIYTANILASHLAFLKHKICRDIEDIRVDQYQE